MSTSLTSILFLIVLNNLMEYLISVILNIVSIQFPSGFLSSERIIGFNFGAFKVFCLLYAEKYNKIPVYIKIKRKETMWKGFNFEFDF